MAVRKDTYLEKENADKNDFKKRENGVEKGVEQKKAGLKISLVEGGFTFAQVEKMTLILRPALQAIQSFLSSLHRATQKERGESND